MSVATEALKAVVRSRRGRVGLSGLGGLLAGAAAAPWVAPAPTRIDLAHEARVGRAKTRARPAANTAIRPKTAPYAV